MTNVQHDSEWRLAAEVLRQALDDAQAQRGQAQLTLWELAEAQQFCTQEAGPWAEARGLWCDVAGVNPVAYRERALKFLEASGEGVASEG